MTLSAAPDYHPRPLPRDFLADSEKHELFLTVRLSRGQNPTNLEKVENYYKLWLFLWYLITLATPPLSTRFSHRPWQAWTLLDSEIFSWQKYLHNYHKLWLCLLCLITLTPPPLHEIFSLTLRSMNSPWRWDYLVVKIPSTLKNLISPLLFS